MIVKKSFVSMKARVILIKIVFIVVTRYNLEKTKSTLTFSILT